MEFLQQEIKGKEDRVFSQRGLKVLIKDIDTMTIGENEIVNKTKRRSQRVRWEEESVHGFSFVYLSV